MLDPKIIRDNPDLIRQNTVNKRAEADIDRYLELDAERRANIQATQELKNKRNVVTQEVAQKKKNKEDAEELILHMRDVSKTIKENDDTLRDIEAHMDAIALTIPNLLHESVPIGRDENENMEIRRWGECLPRDFRMDHLELSKRHGLHDFERGAKISGSGFPIYTNKGARLERGLINYFLDVHCEKHGYTEVLTPILVNTASMIGTGQLPKFEEDMYKCRDDEFYLIPTAEVSITNLHGNEVLSASDLPIKYTGYSPCFRREAGSYGKDTKGFLRLHQFNKVEMVNFVRPEDSYNALEQLVSAVEHILQALGLCYRVLLLCSGDTTFGSAKTYDIEVWSPYEQKWLEVSSCSNFEDFQARRAKIRYKKDAASKPEFVHTLNGSGLATPRLLVALMETYQREDGTISIPEVLHSYVGFDRL